jgi:hypothetical protein
MSGEATAGGPGSDASTGNARASARQLSIQRNIQIYVCKGDIANAGNQEASNALTVAQEGAALSGQAEALSGSDAATGNARAWLSDVQRQVNRQIVID